MELLLAAGWPDWLPQWEAGEELLDAVWSLCPGIEEEQLAIMTGPWMCSPAAEDTSLGVPGTALAPAAAAAFELGWLLFSQSAWRHLLLPYSPSVSKAWLC